MTVRLTDDERHALIDFATLGVSVDEFLRRMGERVVVGEFRPGHREINVTPLTNESIQVSGDDVRWVLHRYIHGKISGEELSNWAGLLLAIPAYELPTDESDDDLLALLNDIALPLRSEDLDREVLRRRLSKSAHRP